MTELLAPSSHSSPREASTMALPQSSDVQLEQQPSPPYPNTRLCHLLATRSYECVISTIRIANFADGIRSGAFHRTSGSCRSSAPRQQPEPWTATSPVVSLVAGADTIDPSA